MGVCSVVGCHNRTGFSSAGVTFHRFPTVAKLRKQWIWAVGRGGGWTPSKCSVVCSVHFKTADLYTSGSGGCRLKSDAVPSMALPVQNTGSIAVNDGNDCHRLGACMDVAAEVEGVVDEPTEASYKEPEEMEILGDETASVDFSKPSAATTDVSKPPTSSVVAERTDSSCSELEEMEILENVTGLALRLLDTHHGAVIAINKHS
ncbi:uncharacterized protein LOC115329804 [Ixodes scapularis]|uniref:uncharacterized protein LOC115329804 n=1 Tax=Ixodes scapularis TaxID=6945 RepID=UPI001C3820CF|nr:uncharacterized protein LOC115329804 [Ixodes scapularis]